MPKNQTEFHMDKTAFSVVDLDDLTINKQASRRDKYLVNMKRLTAITSKSARARFAKNASVGPIFPPAPKIISGDRIVFAKSQSSTPGRVNKSSSSPSELIKSKLRLPANNLHPF